ncbi:triose-phosphate isomerase [Neptunicella sp. SCSIO 80796]|uniref:triose-phosphate isomerase n=1 Tax=Neptunicella plasticusilytica TaxID=3117012 RepID=UPI003A4D8DCF
MEPQNRQLIVAGNWKMNGDLALIEKMSQALDNAAFTNVKVIVCPPAVYLPLLKAETFSKGAQNVSDKSGGAFTGEISTSMLKEVKVDYVIVGHSERRESYAEDNLLVAEKVATILDAGLTPIFCVGEPEQIRDAGQLFEFLAEQLNAVLDRVGVDNFANLVLAYEPIWAIGTGKTATPEQAQEVHQFIRQHIAGRNDSVAQGLTILYGGSVNGANASSIFAQPDVDGGLVGGASLKPEEFIKICQAANELR